MNQLTDTIDKDKLIHGLTLKIFNLSTNPTNYRVLKMLPTDVRTIMVEIKVNKANANARIRKLENAGLIERGKGTGKIRSTKLCACVLGLLELIKGEVGMRLNELLEA